MIQLENKVVLVFGGGSVHGQINNGLAACLTFARAGAEVAFVDNNANAVADARAVLEQDAASRGSKKTPLALIGDVTDPDAVQLAVSETINRFGRIDVLHNNVGIARMGGPIEMSLEEWNLVLSVNLTSVFLTTKYVLPHMLAQKSGSIINVASVGGLRYIGYNYPSYSASKAALLGFTTNLGLEYAAQGIRANLIAPGYLETPMIYAQISGSYDSAEQMVAERNALSPTGKMGEPFDVAYAALYLASDAAKYINATVIPVDGGLIQAVSKPVR